MSASTDRLIRLLRSPRARQLIDRAQREARDPRNRKKVDAVVKRLLAKRR